MKHDNLSLSFPTASSLDTVAEWIDSLALDSVNPIPSIDALENLKFSECLSPQLAAGVFMSRFDDQVGIEQVFADPFGDLIGSRLPRLIHAVLLPFKDQIIYDGLLSGHNITFGGGVKRMLNETYKEAKETFGIITSLPEGKSPTKNPKKQTKKQERSDTNRSSKAKDVLDAIVQMTDAFGVAESTGQSKSQQIRKTLKIHQFDPEWTLPSMMDSIWMLEVNGFPMDIRCAPREAQVVAYEKGLIPYIPADRIEPD